jgi:hypothetical protein
VTPISQARAERIARSHACVKCQEYSYRKVRITAPSASYRDEFNEVWHAVLVCGICGTHQELGIDEDGDIAYAG